MHNPAIRSLIAVIAGVIIAGLVIAGVEAIGHSIFPPQGFDLPEGQMRMNEVVRFEVAEVMPFEAKLIAVVAWFLGSLAGAAVAIAIARKVLPAWIVAVVIAGLGLWTTQLFPHPDWMLASTVVLPLVAVLVAKRLMIRRLAPL